ncbi:MAG: excinuclease ABC subunit UvrA, partial [Deltaproteobacteria bacterium]|nr:excinuclease ABC subunit UvrA [Deltaproteobacteria bacterium]
FLDQMPKPDVDLIEGLSPAISIEQKSIARNPRSTVGTVTEVHDYLRLLFARVGDPHCPDCGRPIAAKTVQQMVDTILGWPEGTRFSLLAPLFRGKKGDLRLELERLRRDGFVRVRVDGEVHDLGDEIELDKSRPHDLEVYVDRLAVKDGIRQRLSDSLELALKHGKGVVLVSPVESDDVVMSERFACAYDGTTLPELTPRLFSFNSPAGACPACGGLGEEMVFDPERIVPDGGLSIRRGAIAPWRGKRLPIQLALETHASRFGIDLDAPFRKLGAESRRIVLHGSGPAEPSFEGVVPNLERRMREYERRKREEGYETGDVFEQIEEEYTRWMSRRVCASCGGARLRREALAVKVAGQDVRTLTSMPLGELHAALSDLRLEAQKAPIGERILREMVARLGFLRDVGLGYLTLERSVATLSGGEAQRIRLATQIGSGLVGVLYVLDEPSIGLHPRDNRRLLETLVHLRDLGNTVLVVEHDRDTILAADYVLDLGPGAGEHGGHLVACGTPAEIMASKASITGAFLSGARKIPVPARRRFVSSERAVKIEHATIHNLRNVTVEIPLGALVCVTGVSGSGKSSLVVDTLLEGARMYTLHGRVPPDLPAKLHGLSQLDKVIDIDQSPIGRTPRSNPATYTDVFGAIRDLFSALPESRARGYAKGRYSFNVKGGRCEACQGDGLIRVEMSFLPDVFVVCEVCNGRRYNRETLEVRYKGHNIADLLEMTVEDACSLLANVPKIRDVLETLRRVGLGYVRLGQSATTLSGGEAQRIKLARELARRSTGKTLYVLDEPTTGLHFADVEMLLEVLHALVEAGNSVVVIEHNLDVVKQADWIIDMGPDGGDKGGWVVAEGTPEEVAATESSPTGAHLKAALA